MFARTTEHHANDPPPSRYRKPPRTPLRAPNDRRGTRIGYNFPFSRSIKIDMEAERLNAIEASLADLRRRAGELRGYL